MLGVVETVALAVIAGAVLVWRVVLRRPWRVVAFHAHGVVRWRVVGWRRARQVVRDAADAVARGSDPMFVHSDLLEPVAN